MSIRIDITGVLDPIYGEPLAGVGFNSSNITIVNKSGRRYVIRKEKRLPILRMKLQEHEASAVNWQKLIDSDPESENLSLRRLYKGVAERQAALYLRVIIPLIEKIQERDRKPVEAIEPIVPDRFSGLNPDSKSGQFSLF